MGENVVCAKPKWCRWWDANWYPHDTYGVWQIIPGRTALRHSANHLNFGAPQLPDFIDAMNTA